MNGESPSESPSTSQDTSPGTASSAPAADTAQTSSEGTRPALSPSDTGALGDCPNKCYINTVPNWSADPVVYYVAGHPCTVCANSSGWMA